MTEIVLTKAERDGLYFIPPAPGGKVVPEAVQSSLQAKGLITAPKDDGRRRMTILGDKVRQGQVKARIEG